MSKTASAEKIGKGATGYSKGCDVLRAQLLTLPDKPGVYRMVASDGTVLYVGKAKRLKRRVYSYTQQTRLPVRLQRMVAQTRSLEIVITQTEAEALLLEANLIQRYMPPFNVLLRDDKSFPYILISQDHDFPQLVKHRGAKNRHGHYFGPFASGAAVTETLAILQRVFMLRTCSDAVFALRKRPCLQYHIKRCTAPCCDKVQLNEYRRQVDGARSFLEGHSHDVQAGLAIEMHKASDALDYERAASFRDRIKILTGMQSKQDINVAGLGDADVLAIHQRDGFTALHVFFFRADRNYGSRTFFPQHDKQVTASEVMSAFIAQFYSDKEPPPLILLNEEPEESDLLAEALSEKAKRKVHIEIPKQDRKKRLVDYAVRNAGEALGRKIAGAAEQENLLRKVAEIFEMPDPPRRIEVYDNSHTSGTYSVGAMIAAGADGFLKKTYRKFNIKGAAGNDDFAMMREVLTRRFSRLLEEDPERVTEMWPDLLLIDGGAGQIAQVADVMNDLGIQDVVLVGVAKGPDRNAGRERFFRIGKPPFSLEPNAPVLYYLQKLRDEAHRFAIGAHRNRRLKALTQSGLDEVQGVGAARKRALLQHFGSLKAVKEARVEDLVKVDGISQKIAKIIYDTFHTRV